MKNSTLSFFVLALLLGQFSCQGNKKNKVDTAKPDYHYPISHVDIKNVKLTDNFWLPLIEKVQKKTIAYALKKCKEEGRLDNFLIAGGELEGEAKGAMPFDDSDVYKVIEGASNSLISSPDPKLESLLDSLISIVKKGQEVDGYLTTWRTINPKKPTATWVKVVDGKRWESLDMSHELYNSGHMYEAAAVHYKATGKRNFLDIALKNADLVVKTFGNGPDQINNVPGHQIIETGLIKLYELTGEEKYLNTAKYFLNNRGNPENHKLYGEYAQDHIPVTEQEEAVGHAVRAVYMYAAMTDIATLDKDTAYLHAVNHLWDNVVQKKMYLTGGIGAKHEGEAFGENYELPNLSAYNETCAAIGNVYWNHRLFNLTGEVKYFDIIERTLYNGLISGISHDGTHFFYPNPLESDGKYQFNQGACTRKEWFDCSCCPTNMIRFLPSLPGLIYAKQKDTIFVNLYASNDAEIELESGNVQIAQSTNYPWDAKVNVQFHSTTQKPVTLKLRVPGWVRGQVLPSDLYHYSAEKETLPQISINGKPVNFKINDGFVDLTRKWTKGDQISIDFPIKVRKVKANPNVEADQNKMALEYGPLVYAFEEMDNADHLDNLEIQQDFTANWNPDFMGGVNQLKGNQTSNIAIPYYTWSNRGIGKMKVWVPIK
ncbi:glycoside hydrolase family 127 protein [Echinicola jeungdonensis]|uniref:Glycoside hydrolase family 127 protein n=1 Tax=Echinicola jeungdonensis TaxID=709343 RepID=A0ABV5J8H4_9BACT|nr:glycoside hydrolase family 127 protein [Echinicola jeungdonensis]MDN3668080.1 glycoside hydrolase family 127 protein [Echinicola jeungdonensis]